MDKLKEKTIPKVLRTLRIVDGRYRETLISFTAYRKHVDYTLTSIEVTSAFDTARASNSIRAIGIHPGRKLSQIAIL